MLVIVQSFLDVTSFPPDGGRVAVCLEEETEAKSSSIDPMLCTLSWVLGFEVSLCGAGDRARARRLHYMP